MVPYSQKVSLPRVKTNAITSLSQRCLFCRQVATYLLGLSVRQNVGWRLLALKQIINVDRTYIGYSNEDCRAERTPNYILEVFIVTWLEGSQSTNVLHIE